MISPGILLTHGTEATLEALRACCTHSAVTFTHDRGGLLRLDVRTA
jgi:hypothetical protein